MCREYRLVLHYLILHVGLLSGNNLENSNSTVGLAEGATVSKKTPPLSDQTGVTFFYQKPKGEAFDVSELFSVPSWLTQRDGVPDLLHYRLSKHQYDLALA